MDDSGRSIKPVCLRSDALAIVKRLVDQGHVAYFAGGCVRDLLLGLAPKDFDVATDAPPQRVRNLFPDTQAVGQAFGVILVRQGRSVVEVATFRTDDRYLDGRHPRSIRFASAQEDARRRDFTINGLFLDPIQDRLIDYVEGRRDLDDRLLRAIGRAEDRFQEDHLRLLRAVRFASRFDLTVESATADAILHHADELIHISPERIAEELRMFLTPSSRARAWQMLWEYRLINPIFRFVPPKAVAAGEDPATGVNIPDSIFLKLAPQATISFPLALAGAYLDIQIARGGEADLIAALNRPAALSANQALRKSLKISNDESDRFKAILHWTHELLNDSPPPTARKMRFMASPVADDARRLLAAIGQSGRFAGRIADLEVELHDLEKTDCSPPPLITGDDLLASGLKPGPTFRMILSEIYDAQLEGRITGREQALQAAMKLAGGSSSATSPRRG